ncbi:MAG: T9SS type A sorting domain-containing protein [Saprospiraceae bacterium]
MAQKHPLSVKFSLFCFLTLLTTATALSQPVIEWEMSYGGSELDFAGTIIPVEDGNFLFSASSYSLDGDFDENYGESDAWLVKIDSTGQVIWSKNYGGSGRDAIGGIIVLEDGYIVAGVSSSDDHDLPGNNGYEDAWVFKVDKDGALLWSKNYGGSLDDNLGGMKKTSDGGFVLAGTTYSNDGDVLLNKGEYDAWILKIDEKGEILWSRTYGGTKIDGFGSVHEFPDGGFLLAGSTQSDDYDIPGNRGDFDAWALEIDKAGDILRSNTYGGSGEESARFWGEDEQGKLLFGGFTNSKDGDISSSKGGLDYWLFKTDQEGELIWSKTYGGSERERLTGVVPHRDQSILYGASFSNDGDVGGNYGDISLRDIWLLEVNNPGEVIWSKNYGGSRPDYPAEMIEANHGYLLLGASESKDYDVSNNYGSTDIWLAKLVFPPSPEAARPCGFQIHPNPSAEYLTIEFDELIFGSFEVDILNSAGQQMLKKKESTTVTSEIVINLPERIGSGFYVVRVTSGEQSCQGKIVVVR